MKETIAGRKYFLIANASYSIPIRYEIYLRTFMRMMQNKTGVTRSAAPVNFYSNK